LAKRNKLLRPIIDFVSKQLAKLALRLKRGQISTVAFVDESRKVMEDGYQLVVSTASQQAHDDVPDTPTVDLDDLAHELADEQHGFLARLMPTVMASAELDEVADRLHSYTDSLTEVYNVGYGRTVQSAHPEAEIIWHLGDTEHCALCIARDEHRYTYATLPGYPGDGGFGGPLCEGGPKCGCWLEFRIGGETTAVGHNVGREQAGRTAAEQRQAIGDRRRAAQQARDAFIDSLPDTEPCPGLPSIQVRARTIESLRRDLAAMLNDRIRQSGGYQGVSVEPQDIPADIINQLLPPDWRFQPNDIARPQITLEEAARRMFTGKVAALDITRDTWVKWCTDAYDQVTEKSEKTPYYSTHHHPLGTEGLWHYEGLQLPEYIQNVAKGIMESGHPREAAIPMAINAIKRWAAGEGHVHPEVRAAARKALAQWEELKATHNKTK